MADVKVHKCFPTIIYEFEHESTDKLMMESYIKQVRKNHEYHTTDDLHCLSTQDNETGHMSRHTKLAPDFLMSK